MLVCGTHTDIILTGDSLIALHVRLWSSGGDGCLLGVGASCLVLCLAGRTRLDILGCGLPFQILVGWQGNFYPGYSLTLRDSSPPIAKIPCYPLQAGDRLQFEALLITLQW